MTTTSDLIEKLVAELKPIGRRQVERRLVLGTGAGVLASFGLMFFGLGVRPDIAAALMTTPFWIKFAYTLLLASFLLFAVERLSRPGTTVSRPALGCALTLGGIAILAIGQLAATPAHLWQSFILGSSASKCPWLVICLAIPPLLGSAWAIRGLAPTRLAAIGLVAGLASGALGAWVYSFHCDEFAVPFLAIWYTLGVVITGAIGLILVRPALRW